jgi:hypothetical protein
MQVVLNAAVEEEDFAGATNNTRESSIDLETIFTAPLTADDLDPSLIAAASAAQRAALTGSLTGPERLVESFEGGGLPVDSWTMFSTSDDFGRIRVSDQYGASDGSFALLMDVARGPVDNLNEAIWQVDLAGVERPILAFSHASFGDERQPFLGSFTGSYNADGIAISVDGSLWHPVFTAPDTADGDWNRFHVDLAERASAAGISLDGPVQIKFQQFDNSPLTDDGRGWDHIVIHESDDADWLGLDLRARESVSLLGTVEGQGDLKVELFDEEGNWLAEGVSPPSPLLNGSFETGDFQHWIVEIDGQTTRPWQVSGAGVFNSLLLDPIEPQDGEFVAWNWLNGTGAVEFRMYQDLAIPENVSQAQLSWQQRLQWAFSDQNQLAREFSVELLRPNTNETLHVLYTFSTGDANIQQMFGDTAWQTQSVDLSDHLDLADYAGQTVRLMFRQNVPDEISASELGRSGQVELDNIRLDLASPWPANVDDLLRDFVAPATGRYYVRVSGTPQTQYSLVVTRNTEFDLEPNDRFATAQALLVPDVAGRQWVMGAIEETGSSDLYQLLLEGGQPLNVETFTPSAGPGQFQNALDPMIVLYDAAGNLVASDDNSGSDGRNAALRYRVPRGEEGVYYLAVVAGTSGVGTGEGEYYVSVRGSSIPESVLSLLAAVTELDADPAAKTQETSEVELPVDGSELVVAGNPDPLEQSLADWLPEIFEEFDGLDEVAEDIAGVSGCDADLVG